MARETPKCSNVWLLSFEPGPNPARTRSLSVLPGPALGPGPECQGRARADLYLQDWQSPNPCTGSRAATGLTEHGKQDVANQ
jgi:hypothetical protein